MHTIDFIILYLNWMSEIILKLKKNKMPIALAFSLKKILIAKKKKKPTRKYWKTMLSSRASWTHWTFLFHSVPNNIVSPQEKKVSLCLAYLFFSYSKKKITCEKWQSWEKRKKNQSCNRHSSHSKVWVKLGFDGSVKCFLRSLFHTQSCWN